MKKFNDKLSEDLLQYHSKIKEWPADERPREKLIKCGTDSLTNAELLAIMLRSGSGKITAVDLAKKMLSDFGSLNSLLSKSINELKNYKGVGTTKAVTLLAAFELAKRISTEVSDKKLKISSPKDVYTRYGPFLKDLKQEVFKVLLLSTSNELLKDVEITKGTLNASLVHPREVFRNAIIEAAAAIILLHNHPSGNPQPSQEDIQITKQLLQASRIVEITIHDHIIIAGNTFFSFAENGMLKEK